MTVAAIVALSGCAGPDGGAVRPTIPEPSAPSNRAPGIVADDPWQQNVLDGRVRRTSAF